MKTLIKHVSTIALAATISSAPLFNSAFAAPDNGVKLLTANFEAREVVTVEAGDFHFKPGQIAPVHTHAAPAIGYVVKGAIIYQVEGEKPQILNEGDAFYEPVGPRILRFDNASATDEAIFIDFNLQQEGEPFIVFEEPLTEDIDRRTLPTTDLSGKRIDQVNIYANELAGGDSLQLKTVRPMLGLVADGIVVIKVNGKAKQRIVAGKSFSIPKAGSKTTIQNVSSEVPAKLITFSLI